MENIIIYVIAAVLLLVLITSIYFLTKNNTASKGKTTHPTQEKTKAETTIESKKEIEVPETKKEEIQKEVKPKKVKPKVEISLPEKEVKPEPADLIIEDLTASINIAPKTAQILLKKLNDFERKRGYLNKDVSLSSLAKDFDTNTKYLSEIVKNFKQKKNFKQYISELRLDYLIEKLNTDEKVLNTKISYLADQFGYNSHSMLSSHFTQYVGKTPVEYIKGIKEAKKNETTQE